MSHEASSAHTGPQPTYTGTSIELRVHGVSGSPPESLLNRPLVSQVGGDHIAGFYRPRLPAERTDDRPHPFLPARDGAPELEGYNWGGLTSGSPGRALWLFLLPFTLINMAPRARPLPAHDNEGLRYLTWLFSRWIALCLTLMLVATAAGIGVNLAGWQCSYSDACAGAARSKWLRHYFGTWANNQHQGGLPTGVMLLLGAGVPLLMLFVLWLLSQRTIDRYESVEIKFEDVGAAKTGYDKHEVEANLDSPYMWRNQWPVRRIRATHMQAGIAAVIWIAGEATSRVGLASLVWPWNWGHDDWRSVSLGVISGAVLLYSFAVLAVRSYAGHKFSERWQLASFVVWGLLVLAGALEVLDLRFGQIASRGRHDGRHPQTSLPSFDANLWVLVQVLFVLLLALIFVVVVQACLGAKQAPANSDHQKLAPGLLGCAGAALATAAVLVAAVFSASVYTVAAAWLHTAKVKPSLKDVSGALDAFTVPDTFRMATFVVVIAIGFAVVVAAIAIAIGVVSFGFALFGVELPTRLVRPGALLRDYGVDATKDPTKPDENGTPRRDADHHGRRRRIERAMFFGALLEKGLVVVGVLVSAGVLMTFVGAGYLKFGGNSGVIAEIRGDGVHPWIPKAEAWGAYGAVLLLLALVSLTSLAFRVPATRRSVGIIWDVASFWPRSCHPLAAPCYAERTVPDLVTRLHHLRTEEDRRVVLAAHSQGTVLSAAALFNLKGHGGTEKAIDGISLLTFGCVLRRLYGRYFPVYFGPHQLDELQQLLTRAPDEGADPRWLNLWRYTDYLGGQVTAGPPQLVPDGTYSPPPPGLPTAPPAQGPVTWEWHAPDPPRFERGAGDTTYSAPSRHSNFWSDESGVFQLAVKTLIGKT